MESHGGMTLTGKKRMTWRKSYPSATLSIAKTAWTDQGTKTGLRLRGRQPTSWNRTRPSDLSDFAEAMGNVLYSYWRMKENQSDSNAQWIQIISENTPNTKLRVYVLIKGKNYLFLTKWKQENALTMTYMLLSSCFIKQVMAYLLSH
jgi:hypothetical protein